MNLYQNPHRQDHAENNAAFLRVVKEFPELHLYQPSPERAPWHWQAVFEGRDPVLLNFWPHLMKAQRDGCKAIEGRGAIIALITDAVIDAATPPFDLIERHDGASAA